MKASTEASFLAFIQSERQRIRRENKTSEGNEKMIRDIRQNMGDDLQTQINNRRKIQELTEASEKRCIPLAVFDETAKPFINYYYSQRFTEQKQTDEDYIEIFKRNLQPQKSTPHIKCTEYDICPECGNECVTSEEESVVVCSECGYTEHFIDCNSFSMAYGESVDYTTFSYKRINHLSEWLNHFQAKHTTTVPPDVIEKVMIYLKENRVVDVTFAKVKQALSAMCPRKYYDQAMQIWCSITNQKPLRLDPVCEEKIKLMFFKIQEPFERHRPSNRCNFLSYPYVMYKFCQLLHYEHLLPYLSLLKGKKKLQSQEAIFEKICKDLGWEFIPIHSHDKNGTSVEGDVLNQLLK